MKTLRECNLCGNTTFQEVLRAQDLMYLRPGEFTLCKCTSCGLHFLNPQPTGEELAEHYPSQYYSVSDKVTRSKLSELVYKTYFSPKGNRILRVLFFPFYPLVRGTLVLPGKNVLDIGCGSGVFLSRMKYLGMNVTGIDPYINENIPELGITKGTIEQVQGNYDVITMNNVLEHVPDPDTILKNIKRLLKPEGVAIIGVPNDTSLLFKLFKNKWSELDLPRHLFLFNKNVLEKYAEKNGLVVARTRYNSVPFEFTGTLFYILNIIRKPKPLEKSFIARNKFVNLLFLPLCHLFALLHISSRIEVTLIHANEHTS